VISTKAAEYLSIGINTNSRVEIPITAKNRKKFTSYPFRVKNITSVVANITIAKTLIKS